MQRTYSLLFLLQPFSAHAQQCVVANEKMNVVYVGIPNPLKAVVEGKPCSSVELHTSNGKVEKGPDPCSFIAYPAEPGRITYTIALKEKNGSREVGRMDFRSKLIPAPKARVAGKNGGTITRNVLVAQEGIICYLDGFDFDARFMVSSFTTTIVRNGQTLFSQQAAGPRFNDETREAFRKLQAGDEVLFSDIHSKSPDGRIQALDPLEFRIIE